MSIITGRPAEQWRGTGPQLAFRPARDLPCSHTPAFAELQAAEEIQNGQPETENGEPRLAENVTGQAKNVARQSPAARATTKASHKAHRRVAARGTLKITPKPVQLTW